jgi:hypothetical protein
MRKIVIFCLFILIPFVYFCGGNGSGSGPGTPSDQIDLGQELGEIGNTVDLPTTSTDNVVVKGVVVDSDADGNADGLDLDGSGNEDLVYVSGTFDTKIAKADLAAVGFTTAGGTTTYYFVIANNTIAISLSENVEEAVVTIVFEDGIIEGFMSDPNLGEADDISLAGLIPAFISGTPTPPSPIAVLSNLPPGITNRTDANITVSGDNLTAYKYSLNSGESWNDETPLDTPIVLENLTLGNYTLLVAGKHITGVWQDPPTSYTWDIIYGIEITVEGADQNNINKDVDAPAVEIMAITTMYETTNYEMEIVKLTEQSSGTWFGVLPLNSADTGARTIIIFDDVFVNPHPYMGDSYSNPAGSDKHWLAVNDDVFSPCGGGIKNSTGEYIADLVNVTGTYTYGTGPNSVWPLGMVPFFADDTDINSTPVINDEVFLVLPDLVNFYSFAVSYGDFGKGTAGDFCYCNRGFNGAFQTLQFYSVPTSTWILVNAAINASLFFTDTNFDLPMGACNQDRFHMIGK